MTRDQFLAEMIGMCWHELTVQAPYHECVKCGRRMPWWNPNFTTPADAYRLMQFVMAQEWWCKFVEFAWGRCIFSEAYNFTHEAYFTKWLFSDPDRFAGLVAEYREWCHD